jgi:hypothetical protein
VRGDSGRRDCGIRQAIIDDALGCVNIRVGRDVRVGGQVLFQPSTALGIGNGVRCDGRYRRKVNTGLGCQDKAHWHHVFADNAQLRGRSKGVLSGTNATLNAVLDSDHREVAATRENVVEGFAHIVDSDPGRSLGSINLT